MAQIEVSKMIDAPVDRVFSTWVEEYADIYKFHPGVSYSQVTSAKQTGVGADRICHMKDQKNWVKERISAIEPNQLLVLDVHATSMPIKSARIEYRFLQAGIDRTKLIIKIDFKPSMGLIGLLMAPIMKAQFKKLVAALLDANSVYVTSGTQINPTRLAAE